MRARRPAVALAALAVAAAAFLLVRARTGPLEGEGAGGAGGGEGAAAAPPAPAARAADATLGVRPAPAKPAAADRRIVVEVVDEAGLPVAGAVVRGESLGAGDADVVATTDAAGRATLDARHVGEDAPTGRAAIAIQGPAHVLAEAAVDLPYDDAGVLPPSFVVSTRVTLALALRVEGAVLLPDGRPAAGAIVFLAEADGPMEFQEDAVRCDGDGRFAYRVRGRGRARLGAYAPGLAATIVALDLAREGRADVGTLRLAAGSTIEGRVRFEGAPPAGLVVRAHLLRGGGPNGGLVTSFDLAGHTMLGDRLVTTVVATRPDRDGRFVLGGLEPAPYELEVEFDRRRTRARAVIEGPVPMTPDATDATVRVVVAPATSVELGADLSVVDVDVRDGDVPLDGAVRSLACEAGRLVLLDRAYVLAGRSYTLRVEAADHVAVERTIVGPPSGTTERAVVALERAPAATPPAGPPERPEPALAIEVSVVADGDAPIASSVVARVTDESGREVPVGFVRRFWSGDVEARDRIPAGRGAVEVRGFLAPGRYRLYVGGGPRWTEARAEFSLPPPPAAGPAPPPMTVRLDPR